MIKCQERQILNQWDREKLFILKLRSSWKILTNDLRQLQNFLPTFVIFAITCGQVKMT